jgi:hypothetical protein
MLFFGWKIWIIKKSFEKFSAEIEFFLNRSLDFGKHQTFV